MPDHSTSITGPIARVVYVPPFEVIRHGAEISSSRGELRVSMPYDSFVALIKMLIAAVPVDEAWYLRTYPDVAQAIAEGRVESARQHYVDDGYLEGRLPAEPEFDEAFYLREQPDVAETLRSGKLASARDHYITDGYREGRQPHA